MPEITVYPSPAPLTFISSDTDVFTVDGDGMLAGVAEGVALLTMTTISGFSQTMTVNVIPMDLSSNGTANCYIVPLTGHFSFKATVKGNNSSCPLDGTPTRAKVLWESYGTDMRPKVGSLISQVLFKDGKVVFKTPEVLKNGNAVIAVQDAEGRILWSWHIWICKDYCPGDTDQASLIGVSGYISIYDVITSSSSSAFMFTNRSSSNPSHRMCSAGTPPSTRELMAISIKVDFPHLRTPGTVMIFFLFIGSFMSRFITSKGIYLFLPVNI